MVTQPPPSIENQFKETSQEKLSNEQFNFIMESPLNFYLLQEITVGEITSRQRLLELLGDKSEMARRLDPLLLRMQRLGLIALKDDQIESKATNFRYHLTKDVKARLFPSLFETACKRALIDESSEDPAPRLFVISDDPETKAEVVSAMNRFNEQIREIGKCIQHRKSRGSRLIVLAEAKLYSEDFSNNKDLPHDDRDWTPLEVQRRLRTFRRAAHDIKPAIASIRALRKSLEGRTSDDEFALLDLALERIELISEEFLCRGVKQEDAEYVVLNDVVQTAIIEARNKWGPGLTFRSNLDRKVGTTVNIPQLELFRLLSNVLENAAHATISSPKKEITVTISSGLHTTELRIDDTGCGIEPKYLAKIMNQEPFTTKSGGNGIGLTTAIELLEGAGGKLIIDSKLGRGTSVRLLFPDS
jgi:signal transduction histidine kinase